MSDTARLLRHLLDVEEIERLEARSLRTLDHQDWGGDRRRGARCALIGARTVHQGHMPEIERTGPDTARGTWAMFDDVAWPAAASGARVGLQGYGHYREEYGREDGVWRIARTHLARLRVDPSSQSGA